ncbi:hypothetical protein [Nocardia niwae]|uniref:hypothetical protein n=1 Tax=Nocardia niwae TaxID=626084 RepID=UPI0033C0CFD4
MNATAMNHPAVEVAARRVADFDPGLTPVAVSVRPDVAAVVLESADKRFTVFVVNRDGQWVPPEFTSGTPRRVRDRDDVTGVPPLYNMSRRWFGPTVESEVGWLSVTGLAALDAVEVVLTSALEQTVSPISDSGLAFGVVRASKEDRPTIEIRTRDERSVTVRP